MDRFVKLYFHNRRAGMKPLLAAIMSASTEAGITYLERNRKR